MRPISDQTIQHASSDASATLAKRLELATELALYGPDHVGRQLCDAIFLEHALVLADNDRMQRGFLECVLLLQMESLLLRFARACCGVELKRKVLTTDGQHRTILTFPTGDDLVISWAERGEDATRRRRFGAFWSDRVLAELSQSNLSITSDVPNQMVQLPTPNSATRAIATA